MTPGKFPLKLYRGDSYAWRVSLYSDTAGSVPFDLTGATVAAQIRDKPGGEQLVDLGCTVELPNVVDVELTPAMWADSDATKGAWDLQVTTGDGQVLTVLAGAVTVTTDVTVIP